MAKGSFTCLIDHINAATTQVPSARLKYENTVTTIHNNVVHYGIHRIPAVLSLLLLVYLLSSSQTFISSLRINKVRKRSSSNYHNVQARHLLSLDGSYPHHNHLQPCQRSSHHCACQPTYQYLLPTLSPKSHRQNLRIQHRLLLCTPSHPLVETRNADFDETVLLLHSTC
jgi:hypothetical protein